LDFSVKKIFIFDGNFLNLINMKKMIHFLLAFFIIFTGLNVTGVYAQKENKTWTGTVSNDWHDDNNWQPNGKPGGDDNVTIPAGTPEVKIQGGGMYLPDAKANSVTNEGTITMDNGTILTNSFTNNGDVNVQNGKNTISGDYESKVTVTNTGEVSGSATLVITQSGNVENNGTVTAGELKVKCDNFTNHEGGTAQTTLGNADIHCNETLTNKGEIKTTAASSGQVSLSGKTVRNENTIETANGYVPENITITGGEFTNTYTGVVKGGKAWENPNKNGKVIINSKKKYNSGKIRSGDCPVKKNDKTRETFFNNISIFSDTLVLNGDSVRVEADTLRYFFNYLKIENVSQYACIWGDMTVEFYGAVADLSENNGMGIISVGYGGIYFYCDNIVAPAQGLNYICDLPPVVQPGDTSITGAFVNNSFEMVKTGHSGTQKIAFQNQSTLPKTFEYSILDQKGWVESATGTTALLNPLSFDSLTVNYTLPAVITDFTTDTVFISIFHNQNLLAESFLLIYPHPDFSTGTVSPVNFEKTSLEVFPVPFNGELTLVATDNVTIHIVDLSGKTVYETSARKNEQLIWKPGANIPGGEYFVVSQHVNNRPSVRKIIYQTE